MSEAATMQAIGAFRDRFGVAPDGVAFAPGRVNLIGEHVDYNDGLVLPMPVGQGTAVAWLLSGDDAIDVLAADLEETDRFALDDPAKPDVVGWQSYVRGMAALWPHDLPGLRLAISGDLPRGAGLSSSASLCIAIGRAFAEAGGATVDPTALARIAQRTEHAFAGVACGIMDQMAVAAGAPGRAMLLDCRDLSYRNLELPDDWAVLVCDSGVTRGLVDGEYNERRAQCAAAARALGLETLRDATKVDIRAAELPRTTADRALHVVGEIARTREAGEALVACDLARFAVLLRESHASLRDLFEVTVPRVDELFDELSRAIGDEGGVRMTGAGFGGSLVVVATRDCADRLLAAGRWALTKVR